MTYEYRQILAYKELIARHIEQEETDGWHLMSNGIVSLSDSLVYLLFYRVKQDISLEAKSNP